MTDYTMFTEMLTRANIKFTEGFPFIEPGWKAVTFDVGPGIAGSSAGLVTVFFEPDGSLDEFMFCD